MIDYIWRALQYDERLLLASLWHHFVTTLVVIDGLLMVLLLSWFRLRLLSFPVQYLRLTDSSIGGSDASRGLILLLNEFIEVWTYLALNHRCLLNVIIICLNHTFQGILLLSIVFIMSRFLGFLELDRYFLISYGWGTSCFSRFPHPLALFFLNDIKVIQLTLMVSIWWSSIFSFGRIWRTILL